MTKAKYKKTSPYYTTPQASWYMGNLNLRHVNPDVTDTIVTIENKYHERPDLLSYDLYGTADYWWVFMVRNPNLIKDPIFDQTQGKTIYVPTMSRLTTLMGG